MGDAAGARGSGERERTEEEDDGKGRLTSGSHRIDGVRTTSILFEPSLLPKATGALTKQSSAFFCFSIAHNSQQLLQKSQPNFPTKHTLSETHYRRSVERLLSEMTNLLLMRSAEPSLSGINLLCNSERANKLLLHTNLANQDVGQLDDGC